MGLEILNNVWCLKLFLPAHFDKLIKTNSIPKRTDYTWSNCNQKQQHSTQRQSELHSNQQLGINDSSSNKSYSAVYYIRLTLYPPLTINGRALTLSTKNHLLPVDNKTNMYWKRFREGTNEPLPKSVCYKCTIYYNEKNKYK